MNGDVILNLGLVFLYTSLVVMILLDWQRDRRRAKESDKDNQEGEGK